GGDPAPTLPSTARMATPSPTAVTRSPVADLLGTQDIAPVGLALTPDTDELVLLDARQGVYVMQADRRFRRLATATELEGQVLPASAFTDIAGLGSGRFALTAQNDGYLFDADAGTIQQHFCYVPPIFISPVDQLTLGVAFDEVTGRILVQPITIQSTFVMSSEVGTFPITGGVGEDWHPIQDPEFLAGAITCDSAGLLWLGRDAELFTYDLQTDTLTFEQSLTRFGVSEITGMVFDRDDLLVVDGPSRQLVCIPAALL
ncbi:MAG: hypothetical protein KAI24_20055, partial [Planctomycetes bacterium]|nr:hypothetical protein [Planctomycetota bacterium]